MLLKIAPGKCLVIVIFIATLVLVYVGVLFAASNRVNLDYNVNKRRIANRKSSSYLPRIGQPRVRGVDDIMMTYLAKGLRFENQISSIKHILFWNEAYGSKDYGFGFGSEGFSKLNCPITECYTTDNRSFVPIDQFDAIVFHLRTTNIEDMPLKRKSDQRWIFWSLESPQYNMQDIRPLNGLFNWTMTYRLDSDVLQPYGWIQRTDVPNLETAHTTVRRSNKTKLVAWMVSNCQSKSKREQYVNALRKYIEVDIYGDCGPFKCSRGDMETCYAMLEHTYKFYLSFENSFCDDYVTEKLYSIMQLEVVPIVFGGADYSLFAPPGSFVDARKFESAAELAVYLKMLDNDAELYQTFFQWKSHYQVRNRPKDLRYSMCGLCSRLHTDSNKKVYLDMEEWWVRESHCHIPREHNAFKIPFWPQ